MSTVSSVGSETFPDPRAAGWRSTADACRELDLTYAQLRYLVQSGIVQPVRYYDTSWWSPADMERVRAVLRQRAERTVPRGRPRTTTAPR